MRIALGAAALAFSLSAAAIAQPAATPADDLDCAMFTAIQAGQTEDAEARTGIIYSMLWFIGRWEGATNLKIDDVMTEQALAGAIPRTQELAGKCAARMMDFGERLGKMGDRLEKAGK